MAAMNTTDFQNCFIFILICFFSLLCYSLYFKKPKDSRACDLPPSPPSLPIIGHLHLLLSPLTHKSLQKLSSKYGTFLHIRIFNTPVILVSSASVAHEIFKAQDVNISSRGAPAIDESLVFGSSGIVTAPYGDYWKFIKKLMVTKLFRPQALEQSRGVRAEELQRFYGSILDKARKNENIDIGKEAMMLMNNNLCRMIMGRCLSKENGEAERIRGLVDESKALTKKIFLAAILRRPLEKLRIPLFKRDIMGVSNRFSELLERILVEHKDNPDEEHQRTDMMDVLLAAYGDENAEFKITMNHVKSFFVEFFIGGSDTSMQTIQWTMAEIINNSSVLERLRDEIDSFVGKTRLIQETDISNLPYLQAVVKEGLRLHPPSPLVVRMFQKSCEIKGFYIPEKTTLVINTYALMRDPDSWEDPNEFKPERFIDSSRSGQEDERKQALKYLPFGGGRRGCPGVNLANIFVGTTIGVMVQCFDWKIEGDKFMKKLLATKILRPQAIEQSRGIRAEELERFYFNILNKATKKESVEVVKEVLKLTNNMICRMSMGRSCSEENGEAEKVMELVIKSFSLTKKIFFENIFRKPLKKLGISLFKKEIIGVSHAFDELLERIMVEHEEKLEEHQDRDMMDMLLEAYRDEKAEYKITRNQIKSLFLEIFIAGTDTSAQTTQWTMAEIINNPNILKRLKEEIDSVVGKTRLIQETDLPNGSTKEGLRLHPPGPLLTRTFEESCEIKGFYIPKKSTLHVNVYAVMRDPNSWENPDEFKPERFLTSSRSEKEDEIREQALKIKGEKVNMEEAPAGMILAMAHPLKCTPIVRIDPSTLSFAVN
ncbi:hypothetical protein AALP_AA3G231500 [Arabis alpina]|uniref:Uncharacterized protein n=1 Tax=Arabis alpina TaxID=50452 RepID=A0A087HB37_ARAAL|nr:hypothetical protein AALP_AA3G231500 [Arabis alpina]